MEKSELEQLANRIGGSTDRLVGTGNRLIEAIERSNRTQESHNKAIVWLTAVIALATVVYATVTVWSTIIQPKQADPDSTNNKSVAVVEVQALNNRFNPTLASFRAGKAGLGPARRGLS